LASKRATAPVGSRLKLVFLDFDGVLNSADFFTGLREAEGDQAQCSDRLDPAAVARLNRLLTATSAKVVVSSSWRLFSDTSTVETLFDVLRKHGFQGEILGLTPYMGDCQHGDYRCEEAHRGHEIAAWLATWKSLDKVPPPDLDPVFVILDDGSDMIPHMDRLVQTSWETGLLDVHIDRCIKLLTGDP
jgi:HAD domain in Swiss Army Knife RNA repair proteins